MFLFFVCSSGEVDNSGSSENVSENPTETSKHTKNSQSSSWFPAANEAIQAAFALSPRFDLFAEKVIQKTARNLLFPASDSSLRACEGDLCRFFFLLGQFALKILQFAERITSRAKKSRQKAEEIEASKRDRLSKATGDDALGLVISANDMEDEIFESISDQSIVIQ